jgi:hypothetical protein
MEEANPANRLVLEGILQLLLLLIYIRDAAGAIEEYYEKLDGTEVSLLLESVISLHRTHLFFGVAKRQ